MEDDSGIQSTSLSSSMDSLLLEDFGQKVDLTRRIREVLSNYPEGTTVLKELIQNADDAGATKVSLCLDRRRHGTQSLLSDKLGQWQGPSLLAYNDAVFKEEDFVSISRIGGSAKHGQVWKTGRFGVGFNSVYHLTDLPSFTSGKYVVIFDPQGAYLPNVSSANPGKRIDFVSSSAISMYRDQFFPYCGFGCNMKNPFHGTLFRFPLRNADQAANSKLSKQAYTEEDITVMFTQLYEEGVFSLLFLKSVLSIEMSVWDDGFSEPRKMYSCSINSVTDDIIWYRQALLRVSNSMKSGDQQMDAFSLEFLSEAVQGSHSQKRTDTFYIVQAMASASSRIGSFAAKASKDFDIHLLPWASIAACVSDNSLNDDDSKVGQAFCFLPLPVKTGFNVQINGYFEVSSNRRGIWYGADMDRSGRIRSIWNRLLLEDVVAPSFAHLLQGVRHILGPTSSYYSLWPTGSFEEPWSILAGQIYRCIRDSPVMFSEAQGGTWVSPAEAYLLDVEFPKSKQLSEALVQLCMPVVHLPNKLFSMILNSDSGMQYRVVTPDSVRQYLRNGSFTSAIDRSYKLMLLEYCLEDLVDEDVGSLAMNLPLLPLANGGFGSINQDSKSMSYFICNELEYLLLQQISERLIDIDIPQNILSRLLAIAKASGANLRVFSIDEFLPLFSKFVPAEWRYREEVSWDPSSNSNHPTTSWFVLFWRYIQDQRVKLSSFADWPILPSLSGHLYQPSKNTKLLMATKLSEKMQNILLKIGCKILDTSYGIEHHDLFHYVYDADAVGVLNSIFDVFSSNDNIEVEFSHLLVAEDRDVLRHFLLDPKWYIGSSMDGSDILNCKRLPIYRVYGEGSTAGYNFSNLLNPQKYLPPLDSPECLLSNEFICSLSSTEEDVLNRYHDIRRMGKVQFYDHHVLNRIRELEMDVRDGIMLSILRELPQLRIMDASFRERLKSLEFVPTSGGSLRSPDVLYDPRNEELYALLDDSESFPCGSFMESDVLDMLQGLGLRTTVSADTIIQSARRVEKLMHDSPEKAHFKGKMLLSYLEVNAMRWLPESTKNDQGTMLRMFSRATSTFKRRPALSDLEKFWNDLRMICWCPVLVASPFQSLPWPSVSSAIAPPKLVRLYSDLWLVSASMRILDGECSSSTLSHCLGWSSPPGGSVIAAQLLELGKNNELVVDPVLRQELALAMPRIYSILCGLIGTDEMDIVKAVLEGSRWVWVGDGFATPDEVVLDGPLHLASYIRIIPIDLAVFKDLFLELGVRESLKSNDYANILSRMATKRESSPLDPQEIRAAILIAQNLADSQFYDVNVKIYLPDVSCRLFSATDLVYNDAPWLLDSDDSDSSTTNSKNVPLHGKQNVQKFVHRNISNDVAEKLGVQSLRRMLLAESADSMNLSLSGAAEAFGQHEALTTRLRHILEMYADGPGILFELVQNAEDARATQVTFLLDKTQYGTSSLLSPEMADWQGPALYCFNDSVFSPQDLYAISRIGQESKLEKPFAIGRFGLGFNSVYHFTDVPSFVSGENIVMFDPHAANLPGISPSHPGLRIKFIGRRILEQFPDQFYPFLHFGCDMRQPFPGTLFRFPLRSASSASRSQIKKEQYAPDDVLSLFSSFSEVVSETLLFLHNVKKVSIFIKEGSGSEMQLLHCVCKHHLSEPDVESSSSQLFDAMKGNIQNQIDRDQFFNKLYKSIGTEVPWKYQKIVISEQNSSGCRLHLWSTCECFVRQRKRNSSTFDSSNKYVSWACVASNLQSAKIDQLLNGNSSDQDFSAFITDMFRVPFSAVQDKKNFEGRAFCFLPLPINTNLPIHVNAYFELSSNRRDIWFGTDMAGGGKKRSEWNLHLLEDVVAPAYGHLLENIAIEIGPCDLYFSFWPAKGGVEPWGLLVRRFYEFISDFGLRVLYTRARGGRWITTKEAIFPDHSFDKARELVDVLSDADLPVVTMPKVLVEKFMETRSSLHFLTPQMLRTLLIRSRREFRDRNAMVLALEYCLQDLAHSDRFESFYGLPLVPLSDGTFTKLEKRGLSERIFVAQGDGYNLLNGSIPNQLLDSNIPDFLYRKFCSIAESENFNICLLTCELLEKLFLRLLPVDWQHARQVNWTPGSQGHPSMQWVGYLWSYLKLYCDDLSLFSKWPILPVENNHLLQLVKNSNVIKDGGWSENIFALLNRVGCLILRQDLPIEHAELKHYVQSPTATGILNALLAVVGDPNNVEDLFNGASEGEMHELRGYILQSKWFTEGLMDDTHFSIIKNIPMFESYKNRKFVSLNKSLGWLIPEGVQEYLLDDGFVRMDSEKEKIILKKYLEIREPSRMEFYKDYVFSRLAEFVHHGYLPAIVHDIRYMIEGDSSLQEVLSKLPFVLAYDGSWKEPFRLYDPRVPQLKLLLHSRAFFPSDKFSDPETLDTLVRLGLRQSLCFTGMLDCAKSISLLENSGDPETTIFASRLLSCLNVLAQRFSYADNESTFDEGETIAETQAISFSGGEEDRSLPDDGDNIVRDEKSISSFLDNLNEDMPRMEFWSVLESISWCPVLGEPPVQGLPWFALDQKIGPPTAVRPKSQMWLASSKKFIIDGECSSYLQDKLGWMDQLDADTLSTQLVELSKSFTVMKSHPSVESNFGAELQRHVPSIYSQLQVYVGTAELSHVKSILDGICWVWTGEDFISAASLAFDAPVKYSPYMHVVPTELSEYRDLLLALGVRESFDVFDYFNVLKRLKSDVKGVPLAADQLKFVQCVLEAIADCYMDDIQMTASNDLFIPDSSGVLVCAGDLVYNDAPWLESTNLGGKRLVHPCVSHDLACKLGILSLRSVPLVGEDMTQDLSCMDYARICELIELYGSNDFLLFDLLEMADCCKAKKLHLIFDKRDHPRLSLLQHNLGEFQGPALLAILEGASLSRDEVAGLQFLPPWSLRGSTLNYGLGLLSCFSISDLPFVVSDGFLYLFDPRGLALAVPSNRAPAAKVISLKGTNLTERFRDQFSPLMVGQTMPWSMSDSTVIRLPLSSEYMVDGVEYASKKISLLFNKFMEHASRTILSLNSIMQVKLSTWEEGSLEPCEEFSVNLNPSCAILRNPFSQKKWKKFQFSSLFGSSNAAIRLEVMDLTLNIKGTSITDRWLVALSLGSGQTRNMALDRRYMAYNLTPVAGVAAHISRDGHPALAGSSSCIMSPLPLSSSINIPITILGYFLVRHNQGRYLFKYQESKASETTHSDAGSRLMEAWNRELMSCVRDSYLRLVLEMQKLRREPSSSILNSTSVQEVTRILNAFGDQIYSFWPKSTTLFHTFQGESDSTSIRFPKADWECLVEQVIKPFYARLVDLPVWQLYSGNLVKAEEGMFLSQPGNGVGDSLVPATVCAFVKEHYPVFSVPWELVTEIRAVGVAVREIRPKMVRDHLRAPSISIRLNSIDTLIDVLDYCLSDIQHDGSPATPEGEDNRSLSKLKPIVQDLHRTSSSNASSSGGDALDMMSSLGKAIFDFGRVVVEDIGRTGGPLPERNRIMGGLNFHVPDDEELKLRSIAAELRGLPCPTATGNLVRLGAAEVWIGNKDQQQLMSTLSAKFIHVKVLDRSNLQSIFSNPALHSFLKLQNFSFSLLARNMRYLFNENWVNHVIGSTMAPWFSWDNTARSSGEWGPSPEWIRLFWKNFGGSPEDYTLFSDWPLIPAFLGRSVLCRVRERHLIFVPPLISDANSSIAMEEMGISESNVSEGCPEADLVKQHALAFEILAKKYPWLSSLLNQCNIPVFDATFIDCAPVCDCLPRAGQSLGRVVASKLVAAKQSSYFPEITSFRASDCEDLFTLFASEFISNGSDYERQELEVLRELPIYKTAAGTYTRLLNQELCMISSNTFLKPHDERCLFHTTDSVESGLLRALEVPELQDQQIFVKFGLPGFQGKPQSEQEDILIYLYMNWHDLQQDSSVIEALKETNFVKTADELSVEVYKPKELFDPSDALLTSVFSGVRHKFPGERFISDGWLRILRKLGLRTSTEADIILECARRVEFLGGECMNRTGAADDLEMHDSSGQNEVSFEIWLMAESLVKAIISNFAVLYSNNFCNALGRIACIPAEKGFPNIGGKRSGKRVLCSYGEAILLKDWPLGWSSAPILSRQSVIPPEYSWGALNLRSPPLFPTVLRHLQFIGRNHGEDTLAHWPAASGGKTIDEASFEVLTYLEKIWGSLSASDISELKEVAFMPAANGTRLVTAKALFARLTINLSPFAFELPARCLPFVNILKDLGLQEVFSVASAKDLIANLQKACGYQRLNPNEFRAVMEILNFICDEAVMSDRSNWESVAIVPDDGCRLVHANSCVYIDSYGSRYLKYIDISRIRFVHSDVPERICEALSIKKLSDVVVEELDSGEQLMRLQCIRSTQLAAVQRKLLNKSFQAAVWSIICGTASEVPGFSPVIENVQKTLEVVAQNICFVECLYTRFLLQPRSIDITCVTEDVMVPEWEGSSRHRALYFVDKSKTTVYIAEPPTYFSLPDIIGIAVSQVLDSPIALPIGSLFLCPEGSEVTSISALKLSSQKKPTALGGGIHELFGKDLLPQDALQVQFLPLRPFYKGEIVAWRSQNGEKLKYGRVAEDAKPSADQALYKLKVEILLGITETLLCSHVFSFRSVSVNSESPAETILEDERTETETGTSEMTGGAISRPHSQSVLDLQHGRVSAAEVVQAVHELLSAVGINMDVEKQSLLQTTLTLQEQLKESQVALLLEQEKSEMAAKEADTAKAAWSCRVCLSNEVDVTLVPCGHVLCRRCSSAVSRCPFCRMQVSKAVRIFRP
ncbi:OLC1v1033309C2 [Oldenlandia corymbosa var. corymbosa]|nr:OLC1v1033309C2 [Oldenlandia corymbosa var. corymbosa]